MRAVDNLAILLILWLLGVVSVYTGGGFVPPLLVVAVAVCCSFELSKAEDSW
jgi:hypothetical protein